MSKAVKQTTKSVEYALDNAKVVATRRTTTGPDGEDVDTWVFTAQTILADNGVNSIAGMPYAESVATTEKERDDLGKKLVGIVSSYRETVAKANTDFSTGLYEAFPTAAPPALPSGIPAPGTPAAPPAPPAP